MPATGEYICSYVLDRFFYHRYVNRSLVWLIKLLAESLSLTYLIRRYFFTQSDAWSNKTKVPTMKKSLTSLWRISATIYRCPGRHRRSRLRTNSPPTKELVQQGMGMNYRWEVIFWTKGFFDMLRLFALSFAFLRSQSAKTILGLGTSPCAPTTHGADQLAR
jgi:hypothetical protein